MRMRMQPLPITSATHAVGATLTKHVPRALVARCSSTSTVRRRSCSPCQQLQQDWQHPCVRTHTGFHTGARIAVPSLAAGAVVLHEEQPGRAGSANKS